MYVFGSLKRSVELLLKIPSARLGEPNDIANAVGFLCSDQSSYINGETLHAVSYTHLTLPTILLV